MLGEGVEVTREFWEELLVRTAASEELRAPDLGLRLLTILRIMDMGREVPALIVMGTLMSAENLGLLGGSLKNETCPCAEGTEAVCRSKDCPRRTT